MAQPRKDSQAARMYSLYQDGYSLEQVGRAFGITRQSVYGVFSRRGWKLRPKTFLPTIQYDGVTYTQDHDGYYRQTAGRGHRRWLHHVVWEKHHGAVPNGHEIHHRDGDKTNNAPENLVDLTPSQHAQLHQQYRSVPQKSCRHCGAVLVRKWQPSGRLETPAEVARRVYCDSVCHGHAMRGKPRGSC
jgi:hypothetical protein